MPTKKTNTKVKTTKSKEKASKCWYSYESNKCTPYLKNKKSKK